MADILNNSKARRDYHLIETIEAGLVLRGTEVKSLRAGLGQIRDAFARIDQGEVLLYNAHIDEYSFGNRQNHQPKSVRKLLLHKREIQRLKSLADAKGYQLIPLSFYWKNGKVKVALAVAKAKNEFDKRDTIVEREAQRDLRRVTMHRLKGK